MKRIPQPRIQFHPRAALLTMAAALACQATQAQNTEPAAPASDATAELPTIRATASSESETGFATRKASRGATKSDTTLYETPQSISVVTREQLDAKQATTLTEALQGVAGVVSAPLGRRGWDDFVIRGQAASDSVFVDGLRNSLAHWVAQEVFGAERIEVIKGPAAVNFGQVLPGGLVNIVSKRPRSEAFNEVGLTLGSYDQRQVTVDLGRPLDESGKAAWRINAMASDRDDPTDFVYFKDRWVAPSLSLDFGAATDFTILTSFQQREYVRQQGLSPNGTLRPNPNGELPRSLFIGEPSQGPYESEVSRIGYALEHRFASGWALHQNFRVQELDMIGRAVFHNGALLADNRTQRRTGRYQDAHARTTALDTNIERSIDWGGMKHSVMAGLDLFNNRIRFASTTCTVPALDLYAPVYGMAVACPATPNADDTTSTDFAGIYVRDRVELAKGLNLSLAARHDRTRSKVTNHLKGTQARETDRKSTGSAALMYEAMPGVAPYASVATSFFPVAGSNFEGQRFKPENGHQAELGVKLQGAGGRLQGAIALYDLTRRNVLASDPDPTHAGYSVQVGEQRTKGLETEVSADLPAGWNFTATATFTPFAKITDDSVASRVGRRLDDVPRRAASVFVRRTFQTGALRGWSLGAGLRHESDKVGYSYDYTIPEYTVVDASVGYVTDGWRANLVVKNLLDKDYYPGGLNNNVVPLGDPRQVALNVVFDF